VQQCTCDASLRALQARNKEVQKLKAEVGDVHAGVCRELQTLETAMNSIVRSEKSLEHPMQVAQSRQSHRTVRPAPECVFDAAEQSLEREISDLGRYTPPTPHRQPLDLPIPITASLSTLNLTQPSEPSTLHRNLQALSDRESETTIHAAQVARQARGSV